MAEPMTAPPDPTADRPQQPAAVALTQHQSGGISLGAYNRIEQVGDLVAGDKITIVVYTGPAQPLDEAARYSLEQAYRSEVAARYAVWRTRYASLAIHTAGRLAPEGALPRYECEELVFEALRRMVATDESLAELSQPPTAAPPELYTFTDLRDGLIRYGDLLLLGPPGGGKTTALWRLALDLAEAGLQGDIEAQLPIFVRLGGHVTQYWLPSC
jgi:hypothetical protein